MVTFPTRWKDSTLIFIEPHYDDFLLNAYTILKGMRSRKSENKPSNLVIITLSHSPVNCNNGLRAILNKRSTLDIRLIELGFPDYINDKANKERFKARYGVPFDEALDELVCDSYPLYKLLRSAVKLAIDVEGRLAGQNLTLLTPLAESYSHPFHRITRCAIESQYHTWYYRDNPYFRKFYGGDVLDEDIHLYKLDDVDRAMKYSLFVNNYEHQVQAQVIWYDAWMLKETEEVFYEG